MAQPTVLSTEDEESLEIEVVRNVSQLQTSATCTSVTNCMPGSISDLSLISLNERNGAELMPMRVRGSSEQKNGCCHSTPLLGSARNNMQLKDYFGRLSLPVTPIAPCPGSESHFQEDPTNILMHRPVGETLLEFAAAHQSTAARLQYFGGTGVGTSDPALTSGFTKLVKNQTPDCATSDVPVCILVELSKKQPRSQHKARLMHNSTPEDILTKLHN